MVETEQVSAEEALRRWQELEAKQALLQKQLKQAELVALELYKPVAKIQHRERLRDETLKTFDEEEQAFWLGLDWSQLQAQGKNSRTFIETKPEREAFAARLSSLAALPAAERDAGLAQLLAELQIERRSAPITPGSIDLHSIAELHIKRNLLDWKERRVQREQVSEAYGITSPEWASAKAEAVRSHETAESAARALRSELREAEAVAHAAWLLTEENLVGPHPFTPEQLEELLDYKVSDSACAYGSSFSGPPCPGCESETGLDDEATAVVHKLAAEVLELRRQLANR